MRNPMTRARSVFFFFFFIAMAVLVAGCAETTPSGPDAVLTVDAAEAPTATRSALLTCPTVESRSASATIGPAGGSVSVAGSAITLPPGAVRGPTVITLTVPASPVAEVEITANDEERFEFRKAARITLDYAGCPPGLADSAILRLWHIDPATKVLIEDLGGEDDKVNRRVTARSRHLSSFAIAE